MNKKKSIFIIILLMISSIAQIKISMTIEASGPTHTIVNIPVAIQNANDFVITGTDEEFDNALRDYNWTVGNISYIFDVTTTGEDDLGYSGRLNNYKVFIDAGGQDEHWWCSRPDRHVKTLNPISIKPYTGQDIKDNLEAFIRNGGSYIGTCGGSSFPIEFYKQYVTHAEMYYNNNAFVDVPVKFHSKTGYQFIDEWSYYDPSVHHFRWSIFPWNDENDPTRLGAWAYLFFSGFSTANWTSFGGASMDLPIRAPNNPIFKDYLKDTIHIRWAGGPAFDISPGHPEIQRIADFPAECLETNSSATLHAWSCEIPPSVNAILLFLEIGQAFLTGDAEYIKDLTHPPSSPPIKYFDWTPTSNLLYTEHANKPAMIIVPYHSGRLLLSGVHPESGMWYGGHIVENQDTDDNTLEDGLYKWVNDTTGIPLNKNIDMIWDQNYWLCRRETAFMSGLVPDVHLPPVYGRSQVVDISPELQEEHEFTIDCCVGKEKGEDWDTTNLSLYYRFNDSSSWTVWTYYDSITDMPYRFTFDAYDANGSGEYQFYSILNTTNATGYYCESPPPGPDTQCVIDTQALVADFTYEPIVAYTNDTITFTNQSMNINATIDSYEWTFEEGTPQSGPTVNQTWTEDGTYTVTLTIENTTKPGMLIDSKVFIFHLHL